ALQPAVPGALADRLRVLPGTSPVRRPRVRLRTVCAARAFARPVHVARSSVFRSAPVRFVLWPDERRGDPDSACRLAARPPGRAPAPYAGVGPGPLRFS